MQVLETVLCFADLCGFTLIHQISEETLNIVLFKYTTFALQPWVKLKETLLKNRPDVLILIVCEVFLFYVQKIIFSLFSWIKAVKSLLDELKNASWQSWKQAVFLFLWKVNFSEMWFSQDSHAPNTLWSHRPWCIAVDETSQQYIKSFTIYSRKTQQTRECNRNMRGKNMADYWSFLSLKEQLTVL